MMFVFLPFNKIKNAHIISPLRKTLDFHYPPYYFCNRVSLSHGFRVGVSNFFWRHFYFSHNFIFESRWQSRLALLFAAKSRAAIPRRSHIAFPPCPDSSMRSTASPWDGLSGKTIQRRLPMRFFF